MWMQALCNARDGDYGMACEHEHSCCVLLARRDTFFIDGRWHTWIDYDRFQVQESLLRMQLPAVQHGNAKHGP